MLRILSLIDRLSGGLAYLMMAVFVALVGDMLYEVVSRRLFGAPTLWAYDIAYMSNGLIFVLAAGYTLLQNEHIRIDFLSTRLPPRLQDAANAAVYLLLLAPMLWYALGGAIGEAWEAFATGELDPSSTWRPLIWPFYGALALGLAVFALQALAQLVRHLGAALGRWPSPLGRRSGAL